MTTLTRCIRSVLFLCLFAVFPVMSSLAQQAIPVEAKERFQAGVALIEKAERPEDLRHALEEFAAAAELAPYWPEIHFNLAQLAAETDKPAKAIKEYGAYLELAPNAADRGNVEGEIVRLQETMTAKRKAGLPGVTFAAMPDGIWVMQLYPGSRVARTGLQKGAKIVAVEERTMVGASLDEFFRAIETTPAAAEKITSSSKERIFSRMDKARSAKTNQPHNQAQETGPVIMLKIIHPGSDSVGQLPFKKSMFHSNVIELEEEEFDLEVVQERLPVIVTFWAEGCEPCREFVPVVEAESVRLAGKLKFINVNLDENKKLGQQLAVKSLPTLMVFKGGQRVSTDTGLLPTEKVEDIINNAL